MTAPTAHDDEDVRLATPETLEFWRALRDGRLLLKLCHACQRRHFYPRSACPFCASPDTSWVASSGLGSVYSYSVMRRAAEPYCIAFVEVDDGVRLMTNIVDTELEAVRIGMSVELRVTRSLDGILIPTFAATKVTDKTRAGSSACH